MANFVLVHGAFHGGWCWSRTAAALRDAGHTVHTPTQTGLGERKHLLAPGITLDTFITDICEVLEAEEITDAVLVGHSFGGIVITGVADRMRDRVGSLIFLDSRILENGQSMLDVDPARSGEWKRIADATSGGLSIPPPDATYFDLPDAADTAWVARRLTPHPLGTFTGQLHLSNPRIGNGRPCTYIACTDPIYPWLASCRTWARSQPDWAWAEILAGHDAMVSAPAALASLLSETATTR